MIDLTALTLAQAREALLHHSDGGIRRWTRNNAITGKLRSVYDRTRTDDEYRANSKFGVLSEVTEKRLQFLWYPYVPYGMTTIFEGDPKEQQKILDGTLGQIPLISTTLKPHLSGSTPALVVGIVLALLAGMGITSIYEFLRDVRGMEEPAWLAQRMAQEDPNAVITELALAAKSEICEKTLDMFVSAYGAEAGNLALKVLSIGGLYVGGGIAPRILEKLKDGTFMKAFTDKGRLSDLLVQMPVRLILESRAALMGAAAYAEARAAEIGGLSERAESVQMAPS